VTQEVASGTPDGAAERVVPETADSYWRSLFYFNAYRFIVAVLLLAAPAVFGDSLIFGALDFDLYVYTAAAYVVISAACFPVIAARRRFNLQLTLQVTLDVLAIAVLMFASGGISSGLGLLLLSGLAAAGLISRGRLALFFAALASITILMEHTVQVLYFYGSTTQYFQAGFLSIGYFATAWVAHTLARYLVATERLAAQREIDLANMAEVSQLVMQGMQDGVIVVDDQGVIRQRNARAEEMLRLPRGRRQQFTLRERSPALADRLDEWRRDVTRSADRVGIFVIGDEISARFVPVGRHRNVGAVIFLEDLSRVQAQARHMKLVALGRLAANMAHEIRNPLSAISHATELLQEEPVANDTMGRLLAIVLDNARRLERMVQDVLKLNRGERAHRERFLVGDYLRTFAEQFCQIEKLPLDLIDVRINVNCEVSFDRSHLNQVMWNLCRNSLRYCRRESGSIKITADRLDGTNAVKLDVRDDGPGVPAELRSQVFEPFFTTASTGSGLGLYIAREVCEANEATLEYADSPGGAHFVIVCQGAA
jgi:two-component system sensor histidine kinase PilS (NtrC family)